MELFYILILFNIVVASFLVGLLFFLLIRKVAYNYLQEKKRKYYNFIYPKVSNYITLGNLEHFRTFLPNKEWKREVFMGILLHLCSTLKSADELYRIKSLVDSNGLQEELGKQLQDKKWWIAAEATRKVGKLRLDNLIPLVLKNLHSVHYDLWTSSARALSLMNKNKYIIQFLIEHGEGLKPSVIIRLGDMLMQGEDIDVDIILDHFTKVDPVVQNVFIEILGKRKEYRILPFIEDYLQSEDTEMRLKALKSIAELGMTTREKKIIALLSIDFWTEKVMAIRVVQSCSIKRALPKLVELLSDPNWWVRLRAAEAISSFGKEGIAKLTWASHSHSDKYARHMAMRVLEAKQFEVSAS